MKRSRLIMAIASRPSRTRGFTLVELMIAIAILAILLGIALPNFQEMIAGQRVQSANSDLASALLIARSEAMKRNVVVEVVPSASGWAGGWTVQVSGGGATIQTQDALHSSVSVVEKDGGGTVATTTITFGWNGRPQAASSGHNFTIASNQYATIAARCLTLGLAGLPEIRRDTDGNSANGCQ